MSIKFGLEIGGGYGPVNPVARLYRESSRYHILTKLEKAKTLLEGTPEVAVLVPEVGMNIAMSIPYAEDVDDVAAIEGRIVRRYKGVMAPGNPRFGCSSHLARYILEIMKHDTNKRAAINVKFSKNTLRTLEKLGMAVSFYDRRKEPEEIKEADGKTVQWGVEQAVKSVGKVPDVIFHTGDIGKEPMIVILGKQACDLAKLAVQLARETGIK